MTSLVLTNDDGTTLLRKRPNSANYPSDSPTLLERNTGVKDYTMQLISGSCSSP